MKTTKLTVKNKTNKVEVDLHHKVKAEKRRRDQKILADEVKAGLWDVKKDLSKEYKKDIKGYKDLYPKEFKKQQSYLKLIVILSILALPTIWVIVVTLLDLIRG